MLVRINDFWSDEEQRSSRKKLFVSALGRPKFLPDIVAEGDSVSSVWDAAMSDKESLTSIEQDVQIEERTRLAMETYVNWLQNAMSASPWANVDLNKKLLGYATESVSAPVALVEKLSHAKNLEDIGDRWRVPVPAALVRATA